MEWQDEAVILSARRHGENAAIVHAMTSAHGRHAGLVRGGTGRRLRGVLQPGNQITCVWRGRMAEQLGSYAIELTRARAAAILEDRARLACLSAICAMLEAHLPEREPHQPLYAATVAMLDTLETADLWPAVYVRWELGLLNELGFGLDLSHCAATGATENLVWVSPKSGRAVSEAAGAPYRGRLLSLPGFLIGSGEAKLEAIRDGLKLTGHFLELHAPHPAARDRLHAQLTHFTSVP